ncbi:Prolyl tripeptidyl peptidase precursor [compost metagenome]
MTENPGEYSLDVYRVDLDTGRGRIHAQGVNDTQGYIVRRDGEVAARIAYNSETGRWRLSAKAGGGWKDIHQVRALLDRPAVFGLGRTPDTVAIADEVDGEWRLMEVSLSDGSERTHVDLGASPNRVLRDANGLMVGVGFMDIYQDYSFISPLLAEAWALLKEGLPGRQLTLVSYSDNMKAVVFYVQGTGEPGSYYLYDGEAKRVSLVGRAYPDLVDAEIAEVQIVRYKAQDGLDLMGYLTYPPGRARTNLPLVVMPHGGPAARDEPGFDWWAQGMASRGYAVFQPQFRGSNGFGQALLEAGYGEWGRKMQTDLSDGVRHLAERGLIDQAKVCIVGASYGGYAALAGATMEPDLYRCAVSVAGVSDLREMLLAEERKGARGDANPAVRYWSRFMGAQSTGDRSIDVYSPARLVSEKASPVLLIHGRNDTIVPFAQSQIMQTALQGKGRLVPLEGEDHYLSLSTTRRQMLAETVAFLEVHNPATP